MEQHFYKTLWGVTNSIEESCRIAKEDNFTGIEGPAPTDPDQRDTFFETLEAHDLDWICEITTCTPEGKFIPEPGRHFTEHLMDLEDRLVDALPGEPRFITTLAGADNWSYGDTIEFFLGILNLEEGYGVPISVETHRGRPLVSPWLTREILNWFPQLKLTCDFSHWCVVSERLLLDEEPKLLEQVANSAYHIHGRIGYDQGAQVPDPRLPQYQQELDSHLNWWRAIKTAKVKQGRKTMTLTPEFGPDGYQQIELSSGGPATDLRELNLWMADLLRRKL